MPYSDVIPPQVTQADFPEAFPPEVHDLLVAALAHEDQRTTRLDAKASAFLSTSGILIPLVITLLTLINVKALQIAFFVSIALAAISGIAAFRALQLKQSPKLGAHVALDGSGVIRADTRARHTMNVLYVLKTDEAVNDHRSNLLGASSSLLALSTVVLLFAALMLVLA